MQPFCSISYLRRNLSEVRLLRILSGPPTFNPPHSPSPLPPPPLTWVTEVLSTRLPVATVTQQTTHYPHCSQRGLLCFSKPTKCFQVLLAKRANPLAQLCRPHPELPSLPLQAPCSSTGARGGAGMVELGMAQGFPPTWPSDSSKPQAAARPSLKPLIPPKSLTSHTRGGQETLWATPWPSKARRMPRSLVRPVPGGYALRQSGLQ